MTSNVMTAKITQDTTTEIVDHEINAETKLLKVLFRLDQGETLIKHDWTDGKNYCLMGMLAEESGTGEWRKNDYGEVYYSQPMFNICLYYGIRPFVQLKTLPEDLCNELIKSNKLPGTMTKYDSISLEGLNDYLVANNHPETNQILSKVLRQAKFKERA